MFILIKLYHLYTYFQNTKAYLYKGLIRNLKCYSLKFCINSWARLFSACKKRNIYMLKSFMFSD